jgi:hypothetical protein
MSLIDLVVYILIFSTSVLVTITSAFDVVIDSQATFFKVIDAYSMFI